MVNLIVTTEATIMAMLVRLGFNEATAQYLVDEEGLDSAEAFRELDSSMIYDLAKSCRKQQQPFVPSTPLRTVAPQGPRRSPRNAGTDGGIDENDPAEANQTAAQLQPQPQPPAIALTMGVFQQKALKQVAFYLNYKYMTSRSMDFDEITKDALEDMDSFKKTIEAIDNPSHDQVPKLSKSKQFEFFDEFTDFLNDNVGAVSKRPLGYVVRPDKQLKVKPEANELPFGKIGSPSVSYTHLTLPTKA